MDELTVRILFLVFGLVFGLLLGWTSRAAYEARRVREAVMPEDKNDGRPRRRLRVSRSDVVLAVLLLVSLATSATAVHVNTRVDRVSECSTRVTAKLLRAVNERTQYTEQAAEQNAALQQSQRRMLTVVLSGETDRAARVKALSDYAAALDAFEAVQSKATQQRLAFPYPTEEEINKCR